MRYRSHGMDGKWPERNTEEKVKRDMREDNEEESMRMQKEAQKMGGMGEMVREAQGSIQSAPVVEIDEECDKLMGRWRCAFALQGPREHKYDR